MRSLRNAHFVAAAVWIAIGAWGWGTRFAGIDAVTPALSAARWLLAGPTVWGLGVAANTAAGAWLAVLTRRSGPWGGEAAWRPLAWSWFLAWQGTVAAAVGGIVVLGHAQASHGCESPVWSDPAIAALLVAAGLVLFPPTVARHGLRSRATAVLAAVLAAALLWRGVGDWAETFPTSRQAQFARAPIAAAPLWNANLLDRIQATRAAFPEAWKRATASTGDEAPGALLARGARLYAREGCWRCHGAAGDGATRRAGLDLSCLAGRIPPPVLALQLAAPRRLDRRSGMPAYRWLFDGAANRPTPDGLALLLFLQSFGTGDEYPCRPSATD